MNFVLINRNPLTHIEHMVGAGVCKSLERQGIFEDTTGRKLRMKCVKFKTTSGGEDISTPIEDSVDNISGANFELKDVGNVGTEKTIIWW